MELNGFFNSYNSVYLKIKYTAENHSSIPSFLFIEINNKKLVFLLQKNHRSQTVTLFKISLNSHF